MPSSRIKSVVWTGVFAFEKWTKEIKICLTLKLLGPTEMSSDITIDPLLIESTHTHTHPSTYEHQTEIHQIGHLDSLSKYLVCYAR